jgi:hypothetical protein
MFPVLGGNPDQEFTKRPQSRVLAIERRNVDAISSELANSEQQKKTSCNKRSELVKKKWRVMRGASKTEQHLPLSYGKLRT